MVEILKLIGGPTAVAAVLIYLGKFIINATKDTALQTHQSNLDKIKIEHQVKFSKMHEKRAQVIAELYSALYDTELALRFLVSPNQGPEWTEDKERIKKAYDSRLEAQRILERNRIYFSESFAEEVSKILKDSLSIIIQMQEAKMESSFTDAKIRAGKDLIYPDGKSPYDKWIALQDVVDMEFQKKRKEIAIMFGKLMGVEESPID